MTFKKEKKIQNGPKNHKEGSIFLRLNFPLDHIHFSCFFILIKSDSIKYRNIFRIILFPATIQSIRAKINHGQPKQTFCGEENQACDSYFFKPGF